MLFDITKTKNKKRKENKKMTMRNRKAVIVSFVLVAVMLMAVGFAALTDNLVIGGEATANTSKAQEKWEEDIYFVDADATATTGNSGIADEASVGASEKDHANYKVKSLSAKGEKATFVFTIQNDHEDYDAKVTIDPGYPTNSNDKYFKVTYYYGAEMATDASDFVVPKAGGTNIVTVEVELLQDPDVNLTAQFV